MAAISRRSVMAAISPWVTLAAADDVNGVQDETKSFDVTGALRVIVLSRLATDGTAGVDVACISHDGGSTWTTCQDGLLMSADDSTGTVLVNGALNAAGAEPLAAGGANVFKFGPYEGPTAFRIFRVLTATDGKAPANSIPWVTGAPEVLLATIGKNASAPTALA